MCMKMHAVTEICGWQHSMYSTMAREFYRIGGGKQMKSEEVNTDMNIHKC